MDYKDYYQILGITKTASEKEIKAAYRELARQYHPDVNSAANAEDRFKEINEAYEVLSDAEKRAKYDRLGADWQRWQKTGGRPGDFDWSQWQAGPDGQRVHVRYSDLGDLGDIFGQDSSFSEFFDTIFGGGMNSAPSGRERFTRSQQRRQDSEQKVEITLAEAYHGTTRVLAKNGRRLEVKIPAGADTGTKVRLKGAGGHAAGRNTTGDLYLGLKVLPDSRFERQGDQLSTTTSLDLYTAVLGGEVPVVTLSGQVKLKIPPGTQPRQTFRLRGKGMPKLKKQGQHGDLLVRVEVHLPTQLDEKQRLLFEELRDMG